MLWWMISSAHLQHVGQWDVAPHRSYLPFLFIYQCYLSKKATEGSWPQRLFKRLTFIFGHRSDIYRRNTDIICALDVGQRNVCLYSCFVVLFIFSPIPKSLLMWLVHDCKQWTGKKQQYLNQSDHPQLFSLLFSFFSLCIASLYFGHLTDHEYYCSCARVHSVLFLPRLFVIYIKNINNRWILLWYYCLFYCWELSEHNRY